MPNDISDDAFSGANGGFSGEIVIGEDKQSLAERLAADVAAWLQEGIESRGGATLVVSGGSTPAPFFAALSLRDINWSAVTVTLADERWVPADDALSNEKLIRECLLVNKASSAKFLSVYNGEKTPDDGWQQCDDALRALSRPFDVVILGMGGDGHTASLFPDTKGLEDACDLNTDRLCWPMHPQHITEARMTLTLPALLDCQRLVLHMTGEGKREVFKQALDGVDLPIVSVIQAAQSQLKLYWAA